MTNLVPFPLQPVGADNVAYNASDLRQLINAIWPKEGVLAVSGLNVTQRSTGANMSVDVSAGQAAVTCDTVTPAGKYLVTSTAVNNVTIPAAPGSGTRTHFIVAQVHDKQDDGGTTYAWAPEVAVDSGTGAVMPASALKLAEVVVTHGQSSVTNANVNDSRAFAVGFGVPAPTTNTPNVIAGTFVAGKPIRIDTSYQEFQAPDDGKFHPACPSDATCILAAHMTPAFHDGTTVNMPHGWGPELHTGGASNLTTLMFQARLLTTGNAITSPQWIAYCLTIVYQ